MLEQFTPFIRQQCKALPTNTLLLAVSGGIDSVVMCHLAHLSGYTFGVAHCNFGLRGTESDADEQFVADLANQYQAPFYTTQFNTLQFAQEEKVSIQMAARALRYTWLENIRQQHQYTFIATAHHQNDNAETMLLNLTKGTGLAGLHGILPKSGKVIRPLLFASKETIEQYAQAHNLPFRTDASNAETKYQRNKIRHLVIPALKELNPSLEETFYQNALRFRETEQIYAAGIRTYQKKLLEGTEKERLIAIGKLLKIKPLQTVLYELFKPYGFNAAQVAQIIDALPHESGKIFYSQHESGLKDRRFLIISEKNEKDVSYTLIQPDEAKIEKPDAAFLFTYQPAEGYQINPDANIAALDAGKIVFPLMLRRWKTGDYFYPLGMNMKKKKLKRFFIDLKLSLAQKEAVWVLTDDRERIVWIAGYRPDERFKITAKTTQVCQITFQKT